MSCSVLGKIKRVTAWVIAYAAISAVAIWVTGSVAYAFIIIGGCIAIDFMVN